MRTLTTIKNLAILAGLAIAPAAFAAETYTIDPAHTSFDFTVKHMMISNVTGGFNNFSGEISYNPKDSGSSKANVVIKTDSIDTKNEKRDAHLKSADFFDAEQHPEITFISTKFTNKAIIGNLTMKGVTKEVSIPVTISGPVKTMAGGQAIGITGSLTINRQDYGVSWNKVLDQGGLAVADNVVITINIEAAQK